MFKYNNLGISGLVQAADATPATGIKVKVMPSARTIQGWKNPAKVDTTVVTTGAGLYAVTGLREGDYDVMAFDSVTTAGDSIWSFLTGSVATGSKTNTVDMQGAGTFNGAVNFNATRMDTQVKGVIVNDRDADGNVIDIDEALMGAQVELYRDGSGSLVAPFTTFTRDTLIATATTDANGAYSFTKLREGRYMVRWVGGTPATPSLDVLRALSTDSVIVVSAATAVGSGANNTRVVGTTTPTTLPRWDYANSAGIGVLANPAHFMFLYKNTTAKGTVQTAGAVKIAGMTISLRRCNVSAGAVSPPVAGVCTSYLGTTVNTSSLADGTFQFDNLTEGVYEIRPTPTTVAGWNFSAPATALYLTIGNGDIENLIFTIS
jgi:hypothetical protein